MSGGVAVEAVKQAIESAIVTDTVKVRDLSDGCGAKFKILVVSNEFKAKPLLQRHRKVNGALESQGLMTRIHALELKTLTPGFLFFSFHLLTTCQNNSGKRKMMSFRSFKKTYS
eukprot:TRINITY_DN3816_c0_g1_i4.p1 TRINITY_DN3816_c0_g1~~TRINITY_DN3816_c0_g1_i4.p1  ORF type:complete len:114 (-),score=16.69 TRINITY_DN3816_c0_g1_i4:79-420(-)